MTDQNTTPAVPAAPVAANGEAAKTCGSRGRGRFGRKLLFLGAIAVSFVAGGLMMAGAHAGGFGWGHHGPRGMGWMERGDMRDMGGRHIERVLDKVGASADQKTKVVAIFGQTFDALQPLHDKARETHDEAEKLLTAPTIDRAALEALRAARIADADAASKTAVKAVADAAEVLTPEQRVKLGQFMDEHRR